MRRNPTKPYEVIVTNDGKTEVYYRFGSWDAGIEAIAQRRKFPDAKITIRSPKDAWPEMMNSRRRQFLVKNGIT